MTLKDKIVKVCDLIINYGILAVVFFIPIAIDFSLSTYNFVDVYKIVFFRLVLAVMLLAYFAKIFLESKLSQRGSYKIFIFIAALLVSFLISSLLSIHPALSLRGDYLRQQGFYNFIHYLLFFALIILNIKSFPQIRRIIFTAIASAALATFYGLVQFFYLDPISWTESALTTGRIFSTLGQPNFFGHYLILVLPLSLYGLIILAKNFWARFFIGLAAGAQFFCLVFTYSRAAWLGLAAALAFLFLAWLVLKQRKKTALLLVAALLLAGLAAAAAVAAKPAGKNQLGGLNLMSRLKSLSQIGRGSDRMRFYYLKAGLEEIKQAKPARLLFGYGPETLAGVFIKYYRPDWGIYEAINSLPDRAHNWLFDQFLSLGALGLLASLAFYSYLVYKAAAVLRQKQKLEPGDWLLVFLLASLVAYFVNNLFSFSLFTNFVYLYLILALAWLAVNFRQTEREIKIKLSPAARLIIWPALLAAAAVFIYTNNLKQVQAEIYYARALKAMKQNNCLKATGNLERVMAINPDNNFYQENYLYLTLNCFALVDDKISRLAWRDRLESQIKSMKDREFFGIEENLGRVYSLFGFYLDKSYYGRAEKIFNDLILKYPYLTAAHEDLARQKIWQGDYQAAIKIIKRALAALPSADHPDLNSQHRGQIEAVAVRLLEQAGQAAVKLKNYQQAEDYYGKALRLDPFRATLYKNLADVYYLQGRLKQAIRLNQRGFMLSPADYHWPLSLSLLYRESKDPVKARLYLADALRLAPENKELLRYEEELNNNSNVKTQKSKP